MSKKEAPVHQTVERVHVARIEYDGTDMARVFLSNGDELVGLRSVEASAAFNDFIRFEIEGVVFQDIKEE